MVRQWSVIAALAALTLSAGGAAMAQSESKAKRTQPAPLAMVEAVQMPAWVERGGASYPLVPGMQLKDNDKVKTGAGARLLLRTADGSAVKLGGKGSLFLGAMQMRGDRVFEATLKVTGGAFRFTSELRSEERRVGKECRSRRPPYHEKKKVKTPPAPPPARPPTPPPPPPPAPPPRP